MRRFFVIVVVFIALLYGGDYAWVRFRIPKTRNPYGVVKVQAYYAVRLKNGKDELYFLAPEDQVCVHSLFPHLGYNPCWYVRRNARKRIDM